MKMFTKLGRLMLMLLLSSAFFVVHAQSGKKIANELTSDSQLTVSKSQAQATESLFISDLSTNLTGETGDSFDPAYTSNKQSNKKGIDGTDQLTLWVLPTNGGTSGNTRAPGNAFLYQRTQYLITAADMAASGFPSGALINSIGFYIRSAGVGTQSGTLNIWLMNTTDVTYGLGSAWTTAGFTQVSSNPTFSVPIEPAELVYDEPFVGGSPFTYTGDGVYVAWEFSGAGPVGTTAVVHWCNTVLASGLYGQRSNVALPTTLAASNWRPATRFGTADYTDVLALTNVYTLGKVPVPFGTPTPVSMRVENVSASAATFDLTLEVRDVATNTLKYTSTQVGINLAANTVSVYDFTGWTPADLEEVYVIGIASPAAGENWFVNNTVSETVNVNDDLFSYNNSNVAASGWGWTFPGDGIFAAKHLMNGTGIITGANVFIYNTAANAGNTVFGCVLNSAGVIVAQSADYVIQAGDLDTWVNFPFTTGATFTDEEFYIGLGATVGTAQYYPLGVVAEVPQRGNTFYNFLLTGGTPTVNTANYKRMIEAQVEGVINCDPPTNLFASNITATNTTLNWSSLSGTSEVEYGLAGFTPTGVAMYTGTSPYTIATLPATAYDFYVRDVCSGPIYSPWILKTFSTFCEECPGGATAEGEGQLPDGSDGSGINGGCAVGDPLLTTPIALGQTYCGESNTFTNNLGAASRDNDYYYLDLTSPTCEYWDITATLQGNSLVNLTIFNAANLDCGISAVASFTTTSPCEIANLSATVPSGHYYVVARVATATGNLWPAGSGPWQYVLTVDGSPQGAPDLDPDPPVSITETVPPAGSTSQIINIGNAGNYDLSYTASTTGAWAMVLEDNFDTYVAGLQLAGQSGGAWTTWGGTSGGADDGFVSNVQSLSPDNSFLVTPNIDQVKLFGDLSSGVYRISFYNYIATGKEGYFNILSDFTFGTGGYWAVDMYFNLDGSIDVVSNHTTITAPFSWIADAWKKVEVIVDLDNDVAEAIYDGQSIYSWPWSEGGSAGTGPLIIDAIDFFGATADNEMYVDDFKLEVAGNDWLTINGGLGTSGTIAEGGASVPLTIGIDAGSYPPGTYTKTINLATNELCGAGSYTIDVTMFVGYSLTGNVYYGNTGTKSMQNNTTVTLTPGPTVPVGALSAYDIRPLANGNYELTGETTKPGNNSQITTADGITASRMAAGIGTPYTTLSYRAADVNKSNSVTTSDAILIKRRAAGLTSNWTAPVFVFDGPFGPPNPVLGGKPVIINNANATMELRCLLSGDLNSSYTPPVN